MQEIIIERGTYNNAPTVVLSWKMDGGKIDKYPFGFGLGKAKRLQQALKQQPDFLDRYIEENDN